MSTATVLQKRTPLQTSPFTSPASSLTPTPQKVSTGQTSGYAISGDFLGGSQRPLAAPNVKQPGVAAAAFPTTRPTSLNPLQDPGNNLTNPGYGEQALNYTQNRLLNDPFGGTMANLAGQSQQSTQGEDWLNQNMGTLSGPGQGDQYWNQMQGQYMDPFAGEQFARQATQQFSPQGASSGFYDQAQGQYGQFTNYSGPQNTQGQYGQSSSALANGTGGENYLQQLAGQYGNVGQYNGQNMSAAQYGQTQQAFGDMPIANFDPFYDRARQLGTQDYNRQAAGRGVYGSSEALSGVGNVITDIEAQRANRSFDAEMQRAQEQRARQELLGNQARNSDLSSLAAFQSNLQGVQTFGTIGKDMGTLELDRNELLGKMANDADTQALGAQNSNIAGLTAFGTLANNADRNEIDRYTQSTQAMNNADKTALDRMNSGADQAFRVDENKRANFDSQAQAANNAAQIKDQRLRTGAEIANSGSQNDLARLNDFNNQSQGAENQRQARQQAFLDATAGYSKTVQSTIANALAGVLNGDQELTEQQWQMEILPQLQAAGMEQKDIDRLYGLVSEFGKVAGGMS